MLKRSSKIVSLILAVATVLAVCFCLSSCGNKNVPVYKGMSISGEKNVQASFENEYNVFLTGDGSEHGNNPGDVTGDTTDKNNVLPLNPFPDNPEGEDIESEVKDSISVVGSSEDIYYTEPYRDVYVNIHIENPKSYEILSFTFNGVKYSAYMFEEGSNLENIIIKVPIEASTGIIEYTIDAMKYINERNEIKDVIMEGDKTVKAGSWYFNQVSAEIENMSTDFNSIEFDAAIHDFDMLIEKTGGKAYAVVYNGENIIGYKEIPLPTDENGNVSGVPQGHVKIDGLKTGTLYQLGIVGFYDNLKGDGFGLNVIYTQTFRTNDIVLFDSFSVDTDRASFGLRWSETWTGITELGSLTLYDEKGNATPLQVSAREMTNLLSGKSYTLVAKYSNGTALEDITVEFTTLAKSVPAFDISWELDSDCVDISVESTDEDETVISHLITLYKGDTLIASGEELALTANELEGFTEYKLVFSFVYNTNDGEGNKTGRVEKTFITSPPVNIIDISPVSNSAIHTGDDILIKLTLDNPLEAILSSITISGKASSIVSASADLTNIIVSFDCDDFLGGEGTLSVTEFTVEKEGISFTETPDTPVELEIFVNGTLKVKSIELTDSSFNCIDYLLDGFNANLVIEFENATGYSIDSVSANLDANGDLTKVSDTLYYLPVSLSSSGWNCACLYSVEYSNDYVDGTLTNIGVSSGSVYASTKAPVEISTADELAAICDREEGGHYELACDIDLANYIAENGWTPKDFSGILIGNGHKIKNLTIYKTYNNANASLGLFASVSGVVTDLTLDSVNIITGLNTDISNLHSLTVGALAGEMHSANILNVNVLSNSTITIISTSSSSSVSAGGIIGRALNLYNASSIKGCKNAGKIVSQDCVGGIIGKIEAYIDSGFTISECENSGTLSGSYVGGVIGKDGSPLTITDCKNTGALQATEAGAGILADLTSSSTVFIAGCENTASISAKNYAAGIIARSETNTAIYDCKNSGGITSTDGTAGGIIGTVARLYSPSIVIERVENSGDITAYSYAGGIFGSFYDANVQISEALNSGKITIENDTPTITYTGAGGIVGYAYCIKITNSMNVGSVSGRYHVGGLIGEVSFMIYMKNCSNAALVCASDNYAGGTVGKMSLYTTSYIIGNVNFGFVQVANNDATVQKYRGGIFGRALCYAQLYVRNCANMGMGFPSVYGSTDSFLTEFENVIEKYEQGSDTFDTVEFYTDTLGFDTDFWSFDELDVRNGKIPELKFAKSQNN